MIISKTPVRISFFGGGSDYREYYSRNEGAVLGTTIDKYVYVSLNRLSNFFQYKIRVSYSKVELVNEVSEIIHPSVRECLKYRKQEGNLDIHIFSDLPARTGLGSSSAFTVGFLNALYALDGKAISKQKLAEDALYVEQRMIEENVGSQDQMHAAYGGFNIFEFSSSGIKARPLVVTREKKEALENAMMVFYTGIDRYANDVVQEQVNNTRQRSKDEYLARMCKMVYEAEHIVSEGPSSEAVANMGSLLHEGWELKKCLSTKISNDVIDGAYSVARRAGAYGGKLCGAGGGGFLMLLVAPEKQDAVRAALSNLMEVKFRFDTEGSSLVHLQI